MAQFKLMAFSVLFQYVTTLIAVVGKAIIWGAVKSSPPLSALLLLVRTILSSGGLQGLVVSQDMVS